MEQLKDVVSIVNAPISTKECEARVSSPQAGAIASFLGVTRDHHNNKAVLKLEYECYESMALSEMKKICQEIRSKWPSIIKICLIHRIGTVPIGEASVAVYASSPHRADALHCVEYGIDKIKARVPIWKKEFYADGQVTWKENIECCLTTKHKQTDVQK